jgi:hypothetical protein
VASAVMRLCPTLASAGEPRGLYCLNGRMSRGVGVQAATGGEPAAVADGLSATAPSRRREEQGPWWSGGGAIFFSLCCSWRQSLPSSPHCHGAEQQLPDVRWGRAGRSARPEMHSIWGKRDPNGTCRRLWCPPVQQKKRQRPTLNSTVSCQVAFTAPSATSVRNMTQALLGSSET